MPVSVESTPRTPAPQTVLPRSIGAFLFDVDGVLADTARLHEAAWRRVAEQEQVAFEPQTAEALRGLSREDSLRRILGTRRVTRHRFEELMEQKNREYLAFVERLSPADVLPGAAGVLGELAQLGLPAAAVSASRNARTVLDRLGLSARFATIVDGANEAAGRVHRYLAAAAALHVEPGRCVVVEDSAKGIAAARQFGMKCIGLGSTSTLCAATLVFESLRGVGAAQLIRWLAAAG